MHSLHFKRFTGSAEEVNQYLKVAFTLWFVTGAYNYGPRIYDGALTRYFAESHLSVDAMRQAMAIAFAVLAWTDFTGWLSCTEPRKLPLFRLIVFINSIPLSVYVMLNLGVTETAQSWWGAELVTTRYLQWTVTTPALILLVGHMAEVKPGAAHKVMLADVFMIWTGWLSAYDSPPRAHFWFLLSCVAFLYVMQWQWLRLGEAADISLVETDATVIKVVRMVTVTAWSIFPIAFILAPLGITTIETAELLTCAADVMAKIVYSSLLHGGSFMALERYSVIRDLAKEEIHTDVAGTDNRITRLGRLLGYAAAGVGGGTVSHSSLRTLSHELRTPLNAIVGFNSLLVDSNIPLRQKREAAHALGAAEALKAVVANVVLWGDIETGGMVPGGEASMWSLVSMVETMIRPLALVCETNELRLDAEVAWDVPHRVRGPRGHVETVLSAVLHNALKFAGQRGHVMLRVSLKEDTRRQQSRSLGSAHLLCFEVIDNGPGIPPESRKAIFEPFVQLAPPEDETTAASAGVGLGLAVSATIVRRSGLEIAVHEREDKRQGAFFKWEMPASLTVGGQEAPRDRSNSNANTEERAPSTAVVVGLLTDPFERKLLAEAAKDADVPYRLVEGWDEVAARNAGLQGDMNSWLAGRHTEDILCIVTDYAQLLSRGEKSGTLPTRPPNEVDDEEREIASTAAQLSAWARMGAPPLVIYCSAMERSVLATRLGESGGLLSRPVLGQRVSKKLRNVAVGFASRQKGNQASANAAAALAAAAQKAIDAAKDKPESVGNLTDVESALKEMEDFVDSDEDDVADAPVFLNQQQMFESSAEYQEVDLSWIKALVVDDTYLVRLIMGTMLSSMGITDVDLAENGRDAVEMVEKKNYDVIFMDIQMPIMDGIEATTRICSLDLPRTPFIVAVTASDAANQRKEALDAGVDVHLQKPVTKEIVREVLVDALARMRFLPPSRGMQAFHKLDSSRTGMPTVTPRPSSAPVRKRH